MGLLATGVALSGCQTVRVGEQDLIRSNAALKNPPLAPVFDTAAAQASWPGATVTEWQVPVGPDLALRALHVQRPGARATVLFIGGNLFRVDEGAAGALRTWADAPVNLVMVDHRGHGRSPGSPTVALMGDDAVRLFDLVRQRVSGPVFVHGFSLGSFVAGHVASARPVDGLALTGSGTTVRALIESRVPWYARPVVVLDIDPALLVVDNVRATQAVQAPVLVVSAGQDTTTPPELGRALFDSLRSPDKRWLLVPEATHGNLLSQAATREALAGWVKAHLPAVQAQR